MRTGFTFREQHSGSFDGVIVKTVDRPVRPDTKEEIFNPSNGDGERSFARANPYGREFYESKIYQMEIDIIASGLSDLQSKITKLSRWIMGSGILIFDDTPLVRWIARIVDTVQYMPEHGGKNAKFIVKYKVQPFAELVFNTMDGVCLDDEIELDSDIPLDLGEFFTFEGAGTHTVKNIGDMPVRPIITVNNATKPVTISVNGIELTVPKSAEIDCENYTVRDTKGNSLMREISGDFFELMVGDNAMVVISSENVAVEVEYNPKYIHNVDIKDMRLDQ